MTLKERWHKFLMRLQRSQISPNTIIQEPEYQPGIADGVNYTLPVIVPGHVRQQLDEASLQKYITEAAQYHHQFGNPYAVDTPFLPVTEDPLQEWAWSTRIQVLTTCHAAYARNPLINSAVQYSADFIIGNGFNLSCKNKQVSDVLYKFIDDELNAIREYERQAAIDLQVDGELFLRIFEGKLDEDTQGLIRVIPLRPWECEYIKTKVGDFRSREMYRFQSNQSEGDSPLAITTTEPLKISAEDIIHIAINRHAYELRGRPEIYRVLAWARADTEFLENRARQNFWRGALLWWVAVKNATASVLSSVSAAWKKPPSPGSSVVTSDMQVVTPLTNSTGGGNENEDGKNIRNRVILGFRMPEYFFADGSDANLATATAQQLPALTRFSAFQRTLTEQLWYPLFKRVLQTAIDNDLLPEKVEEQDADGEPIREEPSAEESAVAIAKTTQKREREQQAKRDKVSADAEVEYEAIASPPPNEVNDQPNAPPPPPLSRANGMPKAMQPDMSIAEPPQGKIKMIETLEAFEVTYEPVSATDPKSLADMMVVAVAQQWASNKTAAEKLGFDPYYERKQIKREQMADMKAMAQGVKPMSPNIRSQGMGQEPPVNGQEPLEQKPETT